ncbi:hypothetical protein CPC16_009709 [Podila verticillata]|nr:hypothetical protein BGZ52_002714 [Haplosporangium bisporale]KAF9212526.1 hypothetical protein BGZ59_006632 [Podila verticillata]KAF9381758.1 hypothetical protein CPC16_009709 [Podila verticillata]KAI9234055.1 MAG: hypothetical protein BYD32DRAFT_424428 [Podila humilis]KFH71243.1 sphingomyelin phosphodiesterase [Podila verticillata NRRL 6337]
MKLTGILPLVAAVAAAMPSLATAANTTFSVLSNNVYFLSETLYPNWGQRLRADLIAKSNYIKGHDVVVFQECFDSDPYGVLSGGLRSQYPYQTPQVGQSKSGWDSTSGSYSSTTIENGGVVIASKWPIIAKHQFIYADGCGADWFSNKGFAYVILNVNGRKVHVFGTHMQSNDPACTSGQAARYRTSSLKAWRSYIDSRNIPANELVIMAGDFNIDLQSNEYYSALSTLDARAPSKWTGTAWTWDADSNSIAHYNYPEGPNEYIDFVFVDNKHSAGVKSITQNAMLVHSTPYVLKGATYNDYSDHYPVQAIIELDI